MGEDRLESIVFGEFATELIERGYDVRFQARGRSMVPTIEDCEILRVRPLTRQTLRVGDVVLFRANGELKAHRIVGKRGEDFVIRGDAGHDIDGTFTRDQILGLVVSKEESETGCMVRLSGFGPRSMFRLREIRRRLNLLWNFIPAD